MTIATQDDSTFFQKLKRPGKQAFWPWILYQTVKGTLTTTLIWVPLAYAWFH